MTQGILGYPHEDLYPNLKPEIRSQVENRFKDITSGSGYYKRRGTLSSVGIVVLGVSLAVGGIFLVLAAYQVLPGGVNALSRLGGWGKVLGFSAIASGVALGVLGSLNCFVRVKRNLKSINSVNNNLKYSEETRAMDSYLPQFLKENELLALYDDNQKKLQIYHAAFNLTSSGFCKMPPIEIEYGSCTTYQDAFEKWKNENADAYARHVEGKQFVTGGEFIETLKGKQLQQVLVLNRDALEEQVTEVGEQLLNGLESL